MYPEYAALFRGAPHLSAIPNEIWNYIHDIRRASLPKPKIHRGVEGVFRVREWIIYSNITKGRLNYFVYSNEGFEGGAYVMHRKIYYRCVGNLARSMIIDIVLSFLPFYHFTFEEY